MNQCSSVFAHAFFLRNSIFKMAMSVFTLKNLKPEYRWTHNNHVRVQTTIIIIMIIIIIISIIITTTSAIIFYSGQTSLSDHVCDDIVISEESINLETCNLLESWDSFLYFSYKLLLQETCYSHRMLSLSPYAYVFSDVYNNICLDIFMW